MYSTSASARAVWQWPHQYMGFLALMTMPFSTQLASSMLVADSKEGFMLR